VAHVAQDRQRVAAQQRIDPDQHRHLVLLPGASVATRPREASAFDPPVCLRRRKSSIMG
jgi:hypothetical protein